MVAVAAVAIVAMLWGSEYVVPDLGQIDYGFPLRWGSHITMTIIGPVDKWVVDLASLAVDLICWFGAIIIVGLAARITEPRR